MSNAGLYVHVPFCSAICPYCDFAVARGKEIDRASFVAALLTEIATWSAPGAGFDSVYFGGGTPSILDASALGSIRDALIERFDIDDRCAWTLEANPEDVDATRLAAWLEMGFRSLSIGVQALDDAALRFLGRRHRAVDCERSLGLALEAGYEIVSVDLIYGLPKQSEAAWSRQLERIAEHGPQHLSCYELTVHEGTPFYRRQREGRLRLPDQDLRGTLFETTHRRLGELGWQGYEVSSFAREVAFRSRHNQKYWRHVPYLGLGPSAHSFDGKSRWWNVRSWREYVERIDAGSDAVADSERLSEQDLALEAVLLALRTTDGLDVGSLERRYSTKWNERKKQAVAELVRLDWIEVQGSHLRPTLSGLAVADELARRLA